MQQPARPPRAPGSFSPLTGTVSPRPPPRRVESSGSEDNVSLSIQKPRSHATSTAGGTPIYAQFTAHPNSSTSSLTNFSRPTLNASRSNPATLAAGRDEAPTPTTARSVSSLAPGGGERERKGHHRKHSATQGLFEPTLPSTSTSNLSQMSMASQSSNNSTTSAAALSASQIAAQAAVLSHQQGGLHSRQRSQTVPAGLPEIDTARRGSNASKGALSPPMVSLTEASGPREGSFSSQGYRNGLFGSHTAAATTAANVVFPRSGQTSPLQASHPHALSHSHSPSPQPQQQQQQQQQPPPPPPPPPQPAEKPARGEKFKGKLFSRPKKIVTNRETDDKPLPSPGKIGLSALQRGNFSTTSLVDSPVGSLYSLANSSSATIRPLDAPEREGKEKEKRHHFLSRGKHKFKEEYHLSSASSNSKPTDPYAPTSLYNFNLPPSPAPTTTSFPKGISDLRHGARRDKKKEERSESRLETESTFNFPIEWGGGPASYTTSLSNASTAFLEPIDPSKYGLTNMSYDDAWPFLRAKLFVIFEGEDLRLPIEDFNRAVLLHIQYCIQRRSPNIIVEDLRDLLATGFSALDQTLRKTPEDRVIPALVELWLFTFTGILPYMQAIFLPLDLEFAGQGSLLTPEQARDFWGGVIETTAGQDPHVAPASSVIDVRRLVLTAYRDIVILPRYETLKTIFSRLSLEFLPSSLASMALASPLPVPTPEVANLATSPSESFVSMPRPGTAMSLDPSVASYNSSSTTLLGDSTGSRSRAISNVSFGSASASDGGLRPFTPSSLQVIGPTLGTNPPPLMHSLSGGSVREQNVEDSKQVTELVGRMLQCMSVLAAVGTGTDLGGESNERMEELCRLLKLNWLGRGRTGRNRRGIVGGRVRRERPGAGTGAGIGEEIRVT